MTPRLGFWKATVRPAACDWGGKRGGMVRRQVTCVAAVLMPAALAELPMHPVPLPPARASPLLAATAASDSHQWPP